jgi:hypothetical protein
MRTTTHVVHGYFFREAAMLTIAVGFFLHLLRVVFGDDAALQFAVTASLVYITASVPLHLYVLFVLKDVSCYVHMAGYWFSYLLLGLVYPAFLAMLWKVRYRND